MMARKPSKSERRLEELCCIKRPLKLGEQMDIVRLRRAVYEADYKRNRYSNDPTYQQAERERVAAYKARRRSEVGQ